MRGASILAAAGLLAAAATRTAHAQHAGIAATFNYTRSSDDAYLQRATSAKGLGAELFVAGEDSPIYGFASLDFYKGETGSKTANFGVFDIGFKFWPRSFDPGLRPWVGGAVGLGGAGTGITPVALGGVGWIRPRHEAVPFIAAEYATRRERLYLKLGVLIKG